MSKTTPGSSQAGKTEGQQPNLGTVALRWHGDRLELLDQRLLPGEEHWLTLTDADGVAQSIRDMVVRGAPAIGISAAYGVALAARNSGRETWDRDIENAMEVLAQSRPTAVNLFWAINLMKDVLKTCSSREQAVNRLAEAAVQVHEDDISANLAMADHAVDIMTESGAFSVLTHCNTGALATGGYGTALGVIRRLHEGSRLTRVYADETRPWLQGSRLTAWELMRDGIPVTLNAEGAAGTILSRGDVKWVVVGADRITANGDVANKIGTYNLAILARHHKVKFMVVAPSSTIDMALDSGGKIPIEERDGLEVREIRGTAIAPEGVEVFNPVFDVTPASLIDVIVTERGVVHNPNVTGMRQLFEDQ
ncbi:MAG: S-methyl-5-thioribose-1-phosphate isomerase [Marinobacter sp.]|uniref:S-methyl-5-thioribose-1-phosphate isomerase n=1 Tax=Marinobacter sp. TaxID=50741 RepID=UPI00299D5ED4|nr:S-methyl-5-thioribose-1-phosphate isomerase [Marinobacter sp.]MDX1634843.1 S-methyl-5-thioribose-1-phosphate isomerase [Marinobacter sp.]